jgi:hypothetical protein
MAGKRPGGVDALRTLHRRLLQHDARFDTPAFHALGEVLGDRAAMLAVARKALAGGADGTRTLDVWASVADALGDADLAAVALRKALEATEGFQAGAMSQYPYDAFWILPYSGVRAHPGFKALLADAGVVAYWRETGHWGDGCRPLGDDDFACR